MKKFDLRKSPVDGLYRKWEMRSAFHLGLEDAPQYDYLVPVVTAVYRNRRDAFNTQRKDQKR